MSKQMVDVTVDLDPRNALVSSIISHIFSDQDDLTDQTLADVVMATMIMCEFFGVGRQGLDAMLDSGQSVAKKAADNFLAQIPAMEYN